MKVAIHQPSYIPWPPYFHKVLSADVFVYLDTVQFHKNDLQNRHLIKTPKGATWLTLAVKHHLGQTIAETKLVDPAILQRHFDTLRLHYRKTSGFQRWEAEFREFCSRKTDSLCDVTIASTEWILRKLGAANRRIRASELAPIEGQDSALVAAICRALKATEYLSGSGGLAYMKVEDFDNIGCRILVQERMRTEYPQTYPEIGFTPDLSTLDLLFNCPDQAQEMVRNAGTWAPLPTHASACGSNAAATPLCEWADESSALTS